jgi:hypothetical protein
MSDVQTETAIESSVGDSGVALRQVRDGFQGEAESWMRKLQVCLPNGNLPSITYECYLTRFS